MPERQKEAFEYRIIKEFSVKETAEKMGCGQGSVKTHLSRAMKKLKEELGYFYEEYKE